MACVFMYLPSVSEVGIAKRFSVSSWLKDDLSSMDLEHNKDFFMLRLFGGNSALIGYYDQRPALNPYTSGIGNEKLASR